MKKDNFETELPEGYELKMHIDAKNKKTAVVYLVLSSLPLIVAFAVSVLLITFLRGWDAREDGAFNVAPLITLLVDCIVIFLYVVLHEAVHGIAYKVLTGAKLTFGLRWNVAFCGVPDIYVYKKAARLAAVMPFIIFNVIFAGLTVGMYFISDLAFLSASVILGLHIGGCVGDLHLTYILNHKFKGGKTLVRDTGPEQFIYAYTGVVKAEISE